MSVLGIGIIGTGSIVKTYAKCISELEGIKLIALYTKSPDRVKDAENRFGVSVFSDLEEFLDHPDMQMVCVCNESGNHGDVIEKAAKAGKHILSEKPLEVTPKKIEAIIAICETYKVKLGCVLQNRCGTDYKAVEKAVKDGLLGKLLMGNAHINWYRSLAYYAQNPWRGTKKLDGGAAFINQGIHTIDLLINLMGSVKSVFGTVKTLVHDIEGEDVGAGLLHFKNGAIGTITAGTALYPGYPERIEIYGEKGSILMEGGKITQWNVKNSDTPAWMSNTGVASGASDPTSIGHLNHKTVIKDMVTAIKEDRNPMVGGKEAIKAVAVITALYASSKNKQSVEL